MLHPASAPDELMAHAVPGMVAIACALGPHSVLAASMVAEGESSIQHLPAGRPFWVI